MVAGGDRLSRRRLLTTGLLAGVLSVRSDVPDAPGGGRPSAADAADDRVAVHGEHQAGIVTPPTAQRHCTVVCCDLAVTGRARLAGSLAALGRKIMAMAAGDSPALGGMAPASLTVTVGLGPRVVAEIDPSLPGSTDLPEFARERIDPRQRGGDLLLQVCACDPLVVALAASELSTMAGTPRWRCDGFRGAALPDTGASRNLLGFADGIVGPHGDSQLSEQVWLGPQAGRAAGGTIAVVRRIALDTASFLALPLTEQERVIGRRRETSEPLSGGGIGAEVDLGAKSADGQYLIASDAHVRRAHPLTSGAGLMLRRSYSTADGLLFICFQRELHTFTATQAGLDERDALMRLATTTASATFLILPGFDRNQPLGATLLSD